MKPLSKKEAKVLEWIQQFQKENGEYPTFREIQTAFSWQSINSISQYLKQLSKKGYVELLKNRGYRLPRNQRTNSGVSLPWLGTVPAGTPTGTQETEEPIVLPESFVSSPQRSFILRVRGGSMENAGICESDLVIVDSCKKPNAGDIVVALVEGESTVKRLVEKDGKKYLKAESSHHPDIHPASEWEIQGVVKGLWRKY